VLESGFKLYYFVHLRKHTDDHTYAYSIPSSAMFNLRLTYFLKFMSVCTDEEAIYCTVRRSIPNPSFINRLNKEIIFNCMNFSLYLAEDSFLHNKG